MRGFSPERSRGTVADSDSRRVSLRRLLTRNTVVEQVTPTVSSFEVEHLLEMFLSLGKNATPELVDQIAETVTAKLQQYYEAGNPKCSLTRFQQAIDYFSLEGQNAITLARQKLEQESGSIDVLVTPDDIYSEYYRAIPDGAVLLAERRRATSIGVRCVDASLATDVIDNVVHADFGAPAPTEVIA